jgi:hypothetical protein
MSKRWLNDEDWVNDAGNSVDKRIAMLEEQIKKLLERLKRLEEAQNE